MTPRWPLLLVAVVALSGCRVDIALGVRVDPGGSGEITVHATADEDVVDAAPGLADDLRADDLENAGWAVEGPAADGGGLEVTVRRTFDSPAEATALLASLNGPSGPLHGVALTMDADGSSVTLSGGVRVDGGINALADPEVLAAVGGTPFADDIAAAGLRPADAVTMSLAVEFPGDVASTTGERDGARATWDVPLDGTPIDLATSARVDTEATDSGWGWVSIVALSLLGVWVVVAGSFIGWVLWERHRRAQRRRAAASS